MRQVQMPIKRGLCPHHSQLHSMRPYHLPRQRRLARPRNGTIPREEGKLIARLPTKNIPEEESTL
jgi:hypothetical protein